MEPSSEIVFVRYQNGSVSLIQEENPPEDAQNVPPGTLFCDLCDYKTIKRKLLIQHMTSNHFYPDQSCKICGKRLNKMQLRLHMRSHDLKFICDFCGKRFGDSKALKNHKNSRVCGEKFQEALPCKNFKCEFCDYRTHTAKLLMTHFRTLHVPKDQQCPTCNKEMTTKQYNSHKNYCNQESVYCDFCGRKFSNKKYLTAHCRKNHPDNSFVTENVVEIDQLATFEHDYEPEPEKENFVVEEVMEEEEVEYMEVETIDEIEEYLPQNEDFSTEILEYRCSVCSLVVDSLDDLVTHMNDLHNSDCDQECTICGKYFTQQGLQRHMRYHGKSHFCPKCGQGFSEACLLKAHLDRKTSCLGPTVEELQEKDPNYLSKEFPCTVCLYRGSTKNLLSRHIRNNHYEHPKDHECPDCGKEMTRQQWQSHRKIHTKVKCPICEKFFSDSKFFKTHLANHEKAEKSLEKPLKEADGSYECTECGFLTKERRFLLQHMKVKHAPKEFECEFEECQGKKFTKTQLRLHKRFHTLAFKCEKCGSGFPDNRDLKRHVDGKRCFKEKKGKNTAEKELKTEIKQEINEDLEENSVEIEEIIENVPIEQPVAPIEAEIHPLEPSLPNFLGIYECQDCNFETDVKSELMEHWNQFHAPRDQPCLEPQCSGKLFSKAQLKVHMTFHKKSRTKIGPKFSRKANKKLEVVLNEGDLLEMEENSWIYNCFDCDFMTAGKTNFENHRKEAHGWKDYRQNKKMVRANIVFQCDECDFETNKEIYLQQHCQLSHAGS